ncbi:GNAT family N-acetyltransferase [Luteimonas sp. FCS-9]|uniref:GNAT family N-acetyltransferase n=1 Tax=Luteimonas sp. FCS-9 TaxID=1547516 RepID=UPI00063EA8E3|nr:GNAT family N-acetyltransferase [Luteimonas sp. FCS-9]KLJ02159.1 acetyltransferase [Luteimonas sp. FCS-9]
MPSSVASPILETERLILRLPQIGDFDRYAELLADEDAARHIGGRQPRAAAWRKFLQQPGAWVLQGFGMFSVVDRADGRWLGQLGPWRPEGWPDNEIGYAFHPDAWGRGYATEAAVAAIDWTFATLHWDRIIHCIDPANAASQQVARRLGSTRLRSARLPAPFDDHVVDVWGQTRVQWREHRRRFA